MLPLRQLIGVTKPSPPTGLPAHTRMIRSSATWMDFHFDTHHFVQRLEREGFTRAQSEGIMAAMADVVDESIRNLSQNMVTKAQQEKFHYSQKVDFAQLKSEIQLVEKNDLSLMKTENDRLMAEVDKLKQRLREEISRTQGRIRDESSLQELKIREVDTRIESEIAGLRTAIETAKQNTLQYLVTVGIPTQSQASKATGCAALLMAYLRFRV
ncbi:uncharacterized protein EI90DRAFT_3292413 [Cantharellus anzutake]|uniref:uncharacterized protein n=1 Tax=Cantharellus anzutake TaxID=1750568 RepID=UPI001906BA92|nr:uncharacterized protein EI90DRAFT_3292413 [Cantharellus anzutake]KAF8323554.1 hypothetical protein EI90DRAFT_3292413 [Cantharellus anzutake]